MNLQAERSQDRGNQDFKADGSPTTSAPASPKMRRLKRLSQRVVTYTLLPLAGAGLAMATVQGLSSRPSIAQSAAPTVSASAVAAPTLVAQNRTGSLAAAGSANFIADAVERVGPAVVRINAARTIKARRSPVLTIRSSGSSLGMRLVVRVCRNVRNGVQVPASSSAPMA
ncbi:MAG: serine protease [Alkalinema sp. RL_2_19]|nr:serine protease [Alkalinema sp. RL_2_19]